MSPLSPRARPPRWPAALATALAAVLLVAGPALAAGPTGTLTVEPPQHGAITAEGIECGAGASDCEQTYPYDCEDGFCEPPVVEIHATPRDGFVLHEWTGACARQHGSPCSIAITSSGATVGARFRDVQGPSVQITAPADGTQVNGGSIVVAKAAAQDNAGVARVDWYLNSSLIHSSTAAPDYPADVWLHDGFPEGDHFLTAVAYDTSGHASHADVHRVRLDRTPPELVFVQPAPEGWQTTTELEWRFALGEEPAELSCRLARGDTPNGPFGPCTTGTTFAPEIPGEDVYIVSVRARDGAGNQVTITRSVWVDLHAPEAGVLRPGPGELLGPHDAPVAEWSVQDRYLHGVTAACTLDGGEERPCTSRTTQDLSQLLDGPHALGVTLRDEAGHETVLSVAFRIDRTPPELAFTGGPAEGATIAERDATFEFAASDPSEVELRCRLDDADWGGCDAPGRFAVSGLADGPHTVRVRATDAAGNEATVARSFRVGQPGGSDPGGSDPGGSGPGGSGPGGADPGGSGPGGGANPGDGGGSGGPAIDATAPRLSARLRRARARLTVRVSCSEACALRGALVDRRGRALARVRTRRLAAGRALVVRLRIPARARGRLVLRLEASDPAGNRSARRLRVPVARR